jgi:hypothetical protein
VMTGIPVTSSLAGLFSGVAYIPAAAMILTVPLWLAVSAPVSVFWLILRLATIILDVVYNFILAIVNVFIPIGHRIGQMMGVHVDAAPEAPTTDDRHITPGPPPVNPRPNEHQNIDPNHADDPPPDDHAQPPDGPTNLYEPDDPNWNPLKS